MPGRRWTIEGPVETHARRESGGGRRSPSSGGRHHLPGGAVETRPFPNKVTLRGREAFGVAAAPKKVSVADVGAKWIVTKEHGVLLARHPRGRQTGELVGLGQQADIRPKPFRSRPEGRAVTAPQAATRGEPRKRSGTPGGSGHRPRGRRSRLGGGFFFFPRILVDAVKGRPR